MLNKENIKFFGKFKMVVLLMLYIILIILCAVTLIIDSLPWWYNFGILIPYTCLMAGYIFYLDYFKKKKNELIESEEYSLLKNSTESAEVIVDANMDIIKELEPKLKKLKEKCSKTSNPFLIKKYLKMKFDFEYACLQIEAFTEYLHKDTIHKLVELRKSEAYDVEKLMTHEKQ